MAQVERIAREFSNMPVREIRKDYLYCLNVDISRVLSKFREGFVDARYVCAISDSIDKSFPRRAERFFTNLIDTVLGE